MKITLEKGQNLWFGSDFHYGHKNIVLGVTEWREPDGTKPLNRCRNFQTVEDMNFTLVENINNSVKENDILIFDGDWSFGGESNIKLFREQIYCRNIHSILGNHDHNIDKKIENRKLFTSVHNYLNLVVDRKNHLNENYKITFICQHYPIASWDSFRKGTIHLFGHLHSNMVGPGKCMDIGIDKHPDFRPYNLDEIMNIMNKQKIDCLLNKLNIESYE
jgi:calcineurin-like phosphoesterase family protein